MVDFQKNFNTITNILILFVLVFGGFIWADTNGVWHRAEDVRSGIFGSDEALNNDFYIFNNSVNFSKEIFLEYNKNCDGKLYTTNSGVIVCGIDKYIDGDSSDSNEYQDLSLSGNTLSITNGNNIDLPVTPSGAIMAFYLSSCPSGWIVADGIGGTTPDLRGTFIRGDLGEQNGLDVLRNLGDYQEDAISSHSHTYTYYSNSCNSKDDGHDTNSGFCRSSTRSWPTDSTSFFGTTETRPKNIALLYCMKE